MARGAIPGARNARSTRVRLPTLAKPATPPNRGGPRLAHPGRGSARLRRARRTLAPRSRKPRARRPASQVRASRCASGNWRLNLYYSNAAGAGLRDAHSTRSAADAGETRHAADQGDRSRP